MTALQRVATVDAATTGGTESRIAEWILRCHNKIGHDLDLVSHQAHNFSYPGMPIGGHPVMQPTAMMQPSGHGVIV